nr:calmodulin-binding protein 60 A-like isoform X3 [Ipomoea trifida]
MAFSVGKSALSQLRLYSQKADDSSLVAPRRGLHIEPGAREKALLADDSSLRRFKSNTKSVRTLKRVGDVLTVVVVAVIFHTEDDRNLDLSWGGVRIGHPTMIILPAYSSLIAVDLILPTWGGVRGFVVLAPKQLIAVDLWTWGGGVRPSGHSSLV